MLQIPTPKSLLSITISKQECFGLHPFLFNVDFFFFLNIKTEEFKSLYFFLIVHSYHPQRMSVLFLRTETAFARVY